MMETYIVSLPLLFN